jgi:ferredoxin
MITVNVIDREGEAHILECPEDIALNLMELCKSYELPIEATCGGMALCATCHVYIENDVVLNEPTYDEEMMLDQALNYKPNSRLACQIKVTNAIDGLYIRMAPEV